MTELFLAVGPGRHGVVQHVHRLAAASSTPVVGSVAELPAGAVVHLDLTDRLLASRAADAGPAAATLFAALAARRAEVVLGLHDLPDGTGQAWSTTRSATYRYVAERAAAVVVCSSVESALLERLGVGTDAVLPLPVPPGARSAPSGRCDSVTVLGFVWPGRGHEEVLAALPDGLTLVCVGGPAAGHEPLAAALAADSRVRLTGYVPQAELASHLAAATIPVAPNRAPAASASICEWWGHGRRPLAPSTPHTRELLARNPGSLLLYDDLRTALRAARADPRSTYLPATARPGPDTATAAADRLAVGR